MKSMIGISVLEFKKIIKKKGFIVGLMLILLMGAGMVYGVVRFKDSFRASNVIAFYGNFACIVLMFSAAKSLGEEFDLKTATFVFTSRSSRSRIFLSKVIAVIMTDMLIGFIGGLLYAFTIVVAKESWTLSSLSVLVGKEVLAYMLYGFVIGAAGLMLSSIHCSTIAPFICLIVAFWIMPGILELIGQKIDIVGKIVKYLVFCVAEGFLLYQDWSIKNIIIFIVSGILFTGVGLYILEKKDL